MVELQNVEARLVVTQMLARCKTGPNPQSSSPGINSTKSYQVLNCFLSRKISATSNQKKLSYPFNSTKLTKKGFSDVPQTALLGSRAELSPSKTQAPRIRTNHNESSLQSCPIIYPSNDCHIKIKHLPH